ncbi:glycosyl hydrolase family 28 protein [Dellaglioa algida]|uniref:glycosyl hydrolase family 28 protein n=1 Tax=Dellaglioa algida TaxID=105612 RepID=UPI0024C4E4E1|nr:glycosyl hydrolase family 28 protein [Dellaglioa algida]MDK1727922.1 glycosyl hydrolase family 28 protein [Dellaglioa algida]MDK1735681.1 glycosyl hydrolase family 28 protein [Dellaglioa algida]MDK1737253.1 glycosyl hydrolase family 28 protein [Dellaglioa algida]
MVNEKNFKVTDYGVLTNTGENQTINFQRTINVCYQNGGGNVIVPGGIYIIGSIRLFSNITLILKSGANIIGSKLLADYTNFEKNTNIEYLEDPYFIKMWHLPPYYFQALISAYDAENVSIIAEPGALINGSDIFDAGGEEKFRGPMGIVFSKIKGVKLSGYIFENSSNWSHTIESCNNVSINNVTINAGHDGFNLHHSKDIKVNGCILRTGDDCFAGYDVQNLTVSDCYLNTSCNVMRIGGNNIRFNRCLGIGPGTYPHRGTNTNYTHAFFKYYAPDVAVTQRDSNNIIFNNFILDDFDKLVFYEHNNREIMQDGRALTSVILSNFQISNQNSTSIFKGNGEHATLEIVDSIISVNSDRIFLKIDKDVTFKMSNVYFSQKTQVEVENDEIIVLAGLVNIVLNDKIK